MGLNSVDPNEVETLHTGLLCPSKNVENYGNTLILRCSGSEHGGTSRFASNLIGDSQVFAREALVPQQPRSGLLPFWPRLDV